MLRPKPLLSIPKWAAVLLYLLLCVYAITTVLCIKRMTVSDAEWERTNAPCPIPPEESHLPQECVGR